MLRIRPALAALLLFLAMATPAAAAADLFTGSWSATDVDGSAMTMNIGNGNSGVHQVVLLDHVGTICIANDAASELFHGSATGVVEGDVLAATWVRARCGNVSFDFEGGQFFMEYLPDTDQLFGMNVVWDRTGS
jgi:hypothetical protein